VRAAKKKVGRAAIEKEMATIRETVSREVEAVLALRLCNPDDAFCQVGHRVKYYAMGFVMAEHMDPSLPVVRAHYRRRTLDAIVVNLRPSRSAVTS
jgi:hypothetical protein